MVFHKWLCAITMVLFFSGQAGWTSADTAPDTETAARLLPKGESNNAKFDFTKLAANGNPLPASATKWSCVKDNRTGLIWEEKTTSRLRSMNNTYTWYNPDSSTNGGHPGVQNGGNCSGSSCDTYGYVQVVNAQGLCGANDWRMPTREELRSIVDMGRWNKPPVIDISYFPHTSSTLFWSASPYVGAEYGAWSVHFGDGFDVPTPKHVDCSVRLVHGGQ